MKKNVSFVAMLGMALALGIVLTGCPTDPTKYTVTFNADGGAVTPTSKEVISGDTAGTLPAPTKSENNFGGWYTAKNGGGTAFTETTTVTANITVYAKWTATGDGDNGTTPKNDDPVTVSKSNEQVYTVNKDGIFNAYTGSGTLKIYLDDDYEDEVDGTYVSVGTLTSGKLTLNLSAAVDDKYLSGFTEEDIPEGLTVKPSDTKAFSVMYFYLFDGETKKGEILFGKSTFDMVETMSIETDAVAYIYSSKAATISGSSSMGGINMTANVSLKKGWNQVYLQVAGNYSYDPETGDLTTTGNESMTSNLSGLPSDMKWVLDESLDNLPIPPALPGVPD
ncbi:hypothetical protein FACS1894109_17450 [Spirochaetia bacterium]|nr:hypothetical protein FACS1894109_17450 [Spirochaetia bacterium]